MLEGEPLRFHITILLLVRIREARDGMEVELTKISNYILPNDSEEPLSQLLAVLS